MIPETKTPYEHLWPLHAINNVVQELQPGSRMVLSTTMKGFYLTWEHTCGAEIVELVITDTEKILKVFLPASYALTYSMTAIAAEFGLEFAESDKDNFSPENN